MPKTPRNDIAQAIVQRIAVSKDAGSLAQEIAGYLIDQGREADLESIMRDVMKVRRQDGIVETDVRVAHSIDDATLSEIITLIGQEFPAAAQVVARQTVDPEVVGGMRIVGADEQLDLSVRGKLDMFKRLTHRGNVS